MIRNVIRKIKRNASTKGTKADFIQVSYFNFTEGLLPQWGPRQYRESTPKQKRLNEKKAKRYFECLVEANFKPGRDLVIHPTFDNDHYPEDEKAAYREIKNWIARLNYRRKKKGIASCQYIIVFEKSKKGRMHFHVLMDGKLDRDTVEGQWKNGFCNADRLKKNASGGLTELIKYLSKGADEEKNTKRWISSTGLVKPWISPVKNTSISKKRFNQLKEMPTDCEVFRQTIEKDNPGYKLLSVEKTYSEESGQFYFFCRMRTDQQRKEAKT